MAELCSLPQIYMMKFLTPSTSKYAILGDRAFEVVTKLNEAVTVSLK